MDWGSYNPQENGNWWVPSTPEKPISQRSSNNVRPETPRSGKENWTELLGIYTGFLQNERSDAKFQALSDQQNSNPIRLMGQNYANANVRNISGPVPDHGLLQSVASCSVEEFFSTDRCRFLNQGANNNVLVGENTQPQKVDSLSDLLSLKSADTHYPMSGLGKSRINYVMSGPTGFNDSRRINYVSVDESQRMSYVSKGLMLNDRAAPRASHEMPNDRLVISYCSNYNPDLLPPRPEASSSSSSIMATHFIPITPDLNKQQSKSSYPISDNKELLLSISDTLSPSQEKQQENAVLIVSPPQSPQVLENEQSKVLSVSAVQNSSSPEEKNDRKGSGIVEIDLNKTPQQKTPKRRKIRPKVVVEGKKPRRTPKKTPEENARPKRKYVRRKGVGSPADETSKLVEESNEGPVRKSCRRVLNFDLNVEAEKESHSGGSDHHQTENYEDNQVPVDSNLLSGDAHCTREFFGSVEAIERCQNTYRNEEQQTKKIDSQGSSQLAFTILQQPTPPNNHTLMNIIARSLSVQSSSVDMYNQDVSVTHASNRGPSRRQPPLQIAPQLRNDANILEERGSTKGYYSQSELRQNQDRALISTTQQRFNEVFETGHSGNDNVIVPTESSVMYLNSGSICWEGKGQSSSRNKNAESSEVVARCLYMDSPQVYSSSKQVAQSMESRPSKEQTTNAIIKDTYPRAAEPSARNDITAFPDRVAVKKRSSGQPRSKKVALMDKPVKKATKRSKAKISKESCSLEEKNHPLSIDFITDRLRVLQISASGKELVLKEENALVPFETVKKRVPRSRVELDSETNRLWNLLMGKEGSENAETMDADKQKWWEEERKVVRGRVDSFIARMHLVQGDRRFSKWKGSVVDSVIGVFLTQNVSDHLSSSAFMSLVSKFPAKSTNVTKTSEKKHEVRITYPDGTFYDQKMTIQPDSYHSSVTSIESSERRTGEIVQDMTTFSNKHTDMPEEEDIVSSQGSTESCTIQNTEDVRSGSGSNSEADDVCGLRKTNSALSISRQAEAIDAHQDHQFQFNSYLQKSVSYTDSWANMLMSVQNFDSREFTNIRARSEHASNNIRQSIESSVLCIQNGGLKNQQELRLHQDIIDDYQNRNDESAPAESSRIQSGNTNNQQSSGRMLSPQTEVGQVTSSHGVPDKTGNAAPNTRKRKAEKEKAEPINWDTLRKQAESDFGVRGRTYENMDSLDYDVLRNTDVREISDAIKERGMNNMLAERIKDFLNRLDRDHGKVELEWLRDVQPDKAKDYLLSIRGLGLKSVECVRLLTLHHLAFPVDTNVGRIAVRLGWVPLQPLPESLQLHLLELYPVLESIQKYLWPRLCKLDQETLYELHYQMITFGKVFCTKRDPNCNACPMRAECRHFASAFASARLALPAPEERRVVSSSGPIESDVNGPGVLKNSPVLLTPAEDKNSETRTGCSRNCEPLIEEPTTPEQPVEFSEGDIEDLFCEDPNEIPVIKLNVEEFAANLHSFMQENMELGEADVSKALVALSPGLASSIPAPKLKNISRLRTEHQVYELPDSHPLLKELDKREPDDPSPYLLAIWTPGETADSVTPPEITCSSREGDGACNNETCFSCNSAREAQAQTVRGTILIPCRTAMRGSFPLNGTYFQVNEVFADHDSSLNPIDVPRSLLWNLPRRTVYFGTSVSTIFKGMSTEDIQFCFWKGFVCVRGFNQKTRAPRPLRARLHFPATKMAKKNE